MKQKIVPLNKKTELDIQYGEHSFQIYQNFIMKSPKKEINVTSEVLEIDVRLNYTTFGISLIAALSTILSIILSGSPLIIILSAFLLMIVNFTVMTGLGILKFEVKEN